MQLQMFYGRDLIFVGTMEECLQYCKEHELELKRCVFVECKEGE